MLRSRRRPRYGAPICFAVLLLLSAILLYMTLTSTTTTTTEHDAAPLLTDTTDLDFSSSDPKDFLHKQSSSPVIVGVATGAFLFLADLVREINLPITVDFVRIESYGAGVVSNGNPRIRVIVV